MWYPGRFGYAFTKALTIAGSLGGSKVNRKGTGWKTDGTYWSLDGGEVASGAEHTVISGTRVTPSRSFARVLASSVCLGLTRRGEVTPAVASGARAMSDMSPEGVPASLTRSGATADEKGGGDDRSAPLLPQGDAVIELAAAARVGDRCYRHAAGGGVPCRSCCRGT
jgi:hypothetical protein